MYRKSYCKTTSVGDGVGVVVCVCGGGGVNKLLWFYVRVLCDRQSVAMRAILYADISCLKLKLRFFHKGYDFSGECNMTVAVTTVDLTPPKRGHMTAGPYYDMVCSKRKFNTFVSLYSFMAF